MRIHIDTEEPTWMGDTATDRELAATICTAAQWLMSGWNWSSARPGSHARGVGRTGRR